MVEDGESPKRTHSRKGAPIASYRPRMSIGGVTCVFCGNVVSFEGAGTVFGCSVCRAPSGGAVTASSAAKVADELRKRFTRL